ncbi:MAG: DUF5913 domain-containing protein, partial [Actinomycetaceae bacterium]|nr:DUF5913 domain-containing protein [Actinomycetaceae bacterium]
GKEQLARAMRKQHLPLQRLMNHDTIVSIAVAMGYRDISALYAAIGDSQVSAQTVVQRVIEALGGDSGTEETLAEAVTPGKQQRWDHPSTVGADVVVEGMGANDVWVKIAKCCTPVPGDPIVGFITRGQGVSVHSPDCTNAQALQRNHPERFVKVEWNSRASSNFLVKIQIKGLDRAGLLGDLTQVLTDYQVNILSGNMSTSTDRVATVRFTVEMAETSHINATLSGLRRVDGVFEAVRVHGRKSSKAKNMKKQKQPR